MKYTIPKHTPSHISNQYGFTLIELMISLVLGLLISAAVMQVFLTSQRVDRMQTAGSEIQDKAVFGLQSIEPQIRLALGQAHRHHAGLHRHCHTRHHRASTRTTSIRSSLRPSENITELVT